MNIAEKIFYFFPAFYYLNPAFAPATLNHRNILGIVQCPRKGLQPRFQLLLINIRHAHPFNTAKEFAGVLRCDHDAVPHYPHLDGHPVNKTRLRHPVAV